MEHQTQDAHWTIILKVNFQIKKKYPKVINSKIYKFSLSKFQTFPIKFTPFSLNFI